MVPCCRQTQIQPGLPFLGVRYTTVLTENFSLTVTRGGPR